MLLLLARMQRLVSLLCCIKMIFSPSFLPIQPSSLKVSFFFSSTPFLLFWRGSQCLSTSVCWMLLTPLCYTELFACLPGIEIDPGDIADQRLAYWQHSVLMDLRWLSIRKNNPSGAGNYYISASVWTGCIDCTAHPYNLMHWVRWFIYSFPCYRCSIVE